jgi:hypothetical protein
MEIPPNTYYVYIIDKEKKYNQERIKMELCEKNENN